MSGASKDLAHEGGEPSIERKEGWGRKSISVLLIKDGFVKVSFGTKQN